MRELPLSFSRGRALSWIGTALPIGVCLSIWLQGADVRWLTTLHHVIGGAVLVWTALRLARRPGVLLPAHLAETLGEYWAAADGAVMILYGLLMLQPVLELAGRMLAGGGLVVWGVTVLPADASLAQDIVRVHGINALVLLVLIGVQIVREAYGRLGGNRTGPSYRRAPS